MHLIERTQALIAQKELGTTEHRHSATVLVGLAVFGWIFSFALWLLLRLSTGGSLFILHTNILRPDLWALGWTLSVWASGATAAVMLARRQREWRRVL
jgi:hypothetical protein